MTTLVEINTKELEIKDTGGYLIVDREVFLLGTKTTTLGRHSGNDCVINGPYTSRRHATIEFVRGNYVIHDLQSTSGTFINKKRIDSQVLTNGDIITLGKSPVIFMYDETDIFEKHEQETGGLP